jgi:hypothetical protein
VLGFVQELVDILSVRKCDALHCECVLSNVRRVTFMLSATIFLLFSSLLRRCCHSPSDVTTH